MYVCTYFLTKAGSNALRSLISMINRRSPRSSMERILSVYGPWGNWWCALHYITLLL